MASELTTSTPAAGLSRESLRVFIERYVTPVTVVIFVASLFTTGLISFELSFLSVTSWDFAIALLAVNAGLLLIVGDRSALRTSRFVTVLAVSFGVWVLVAALRSPEEVRGLSMAGLMVRNYIMVFALLVIFRNSIELSWFNRTILLTGIAMAVVALVFFFPNVDLDQGRRPLGSIIILIDEFNIPRLTGLLSDPNFFALTALIALFFVFDFKNTVANILTHAGIAILAAAIIFSFSRAGYAALAAGLTAIVLVALLQRERRNRRALLLKLTIMVSILVLTLTFLSQLELNDNRSVFELTEERFYGISDSPRFGLWQKVVDEPSKTETTFWDVLFGNGLRSNEVLLGTYSHNSYLDVSQEMGIIGAVLWGVIVISVGFALLRYSRSNSAGIPWLPVLGIILVMMIALSMLFMPYFWITVAVAIYVSDKRSVESRTDSVADKIAPATPA